MVFRGKAVSFVRRARAALSRSRLDRELREEIAQHVEMRRQQLIADGTDPNVADAVLFRSLAVRDPGQLRAFRGTVHMGGGTKVLDGVDAPTLARIQEGADFASFLGFRSATDVTIEARGNNPRSANVEF